MVHGSLDYTTMSLKQTRFMVLNSHTGENGKRNEVDFGHCRRVKNILKIFKNIKLENNCLTTGQYRYFMLILLL